MAAEDVINTAYLKTLGRPADPEGLAFYSAQLEAGRPVGEILADLNFAVESGKENVEANRLAYSDVYNASGGASVVQPTGGGTQGATVNPPVGVGGSREAINKLEQEKANNAYINKLYEKYLGRSGSPQELSSYANIFGPEVDQDETRAFILGGVKSGELTQDQADKFLSDGRPAVMGGKGGKGGSNFSVQRPPSNVLANQQRQMDLERSLAEQNAYQNLRYDPNISQRYRQPSYMNFQNYNYGGFSSPYNYQFQQPAPSFAPSYYSPYVNQFGADQYYQQPYSPYQQPYSPYQSSYQPMPAYSQPIGRGKGGFQQPFQPNFQQPFQPSFQSNFQQPFQSNFQPSFQQPPQSSFQFNSMGGGGRPASFGGKGAPASMGGKR
jgi:hypothetical protein